MKNIKEHLDTLHAKPHHVRKRIAFVSAFSGAALIGLLWFGVSLSAGTYAITGSNFAQSTGAVGESPAVNAGPASGSQVAGAAGAFGSAPQAAHIQIINTVTPSSHATSSAEQTVIPF